MRSSSCCRVDYKNQPISAVCSWSLAFGKNSIIKVHEGRSSLFHEVWEGYILCQDKATVHATFVVSWRETIEVPFYGFQRV
jgi:hypothetical protein